MNILILPTAYPNIYNQNSAIFVQNQAEALSKDCDINISVVGAIPISLKEIWRIKLFKFGYFKSKKNNVHVTLFLFPSIPKAKRLNSFIRYFLNRLLLKQHIKVKKTDLIHVHNSVAAKAALWFKKQYHIPYCITEHSTAFARGLISNNELKDYGKFYKYSAYNIAVSQEFCTLLSKIYNLTFNYIPNSVNTDFFIPKNHKSDKEFRFINVAYLNRKKNHLLLIRAFQKIFFKTSNVTLSILGNGIEYNILKKEIETLKMQGQIKLYGVASRDEVLSELQHSDAFILSSEYETFGVVLIEAMSCGLPVIATRSGGPESIVKNERLGLLVEPNNLEELSKAMLKTYSSNFDKNYIREYTIENFSQRSIAKKLYKLYTHIINTKTP